MKEFAQAKSFTTVQSKGFRQRGKKKKAERFSRSHRAGSDTTHSTTKNCLVTVSKVKSEAAQYSLVQKDPFLYLGDATFH